ncbi:9902_t:CDS:2, partial [Gigaspora margarita]
LGCKTIKLQELLKGALYSDIDIDVDVNIPNSNLVQVHYLNKQYSLYESILDYNGYSYKISYNDNNKIYKNGSHDKVCINSAKFFELKVIDGEGPTIA